MTVMRVKSPLGAVCVCVLLLAVIIIIISAYFCGKKGGLCKALWNMFCHVCFPHDCNDSDDDDDIDGMMMMTVVVVGSRTTNAFTIKFHDVPLRCFSGLLVSLDALLSLGEKTLV